MKYWTLFCICSLALIYSEAQAQATPTSGQLHIHIFGAYDDDTVSLPGASVYWAETTMGAASDASGVAHLDPYRHLPHHLVIRYVGFYSDTILITNPDKKHYYVFLVNEEMMDAVEIVREKRSQFISVINPLKTEIISADELRKAACCDLSESFETNASVDVSYSDAVTGAKEIMLLGLDGIYVEMLQENVPALRGLAIPFGLTYVPGPWVETIYISKGAGTVLNGHESITGSIIYKYRMPLETDPLNLDLFANHEGRYEANIVTGLELSEKDGVVFAANVGGMHSRHDRNDDGFLDKPLYDRINLMNRWKFMGDKANGQFYINYLYDDRQSGQMDFDPERHLGSDLAYGFGMTTKRFEGYGKTGFFFKDNPNQNVGTIYNFSWHDQAGYFGQRNYTGSQLSGNATVFFQTIIRSTDHGLVVGANAYADKYEEQFADIELNDTDWNVGYFAEYSYCLVDKFRLVAGYRMDYHSDFGVRFSPRIHTKWSVTPETSLRFSIGSGFRSARILGENISLMASSREFIVEEAPGIESAWNTGVSLNQEFTLAERTGYFSVDYFFTWFTDQVIIDLEQRDNAVHFYNLDGRSYANSFQAEIGYEVVNGLELRIAYKLDDVKITLRSGLQPRHFNYLHKGLLVANYKSPSHMWQLDMNLNLHGKHRLSDLTGEDIAPSYSPFFAVLNAQVSRFFKNGIELYVGAENLANFTQKDPIVGADDPFGDSFDTSQVWGPIGGSMFYGGFRYILKKKS